MEIFKVFLYIVLIEFPQMVLAEKIVLMVKDNKVIINAQLVILTVINVQYQVVYNVAHHTIYIKVIVFQRALKDIIKIMWHLYAKLVLLIV